LEFIYIHVLFRTLFTSVRPSVRLTHTSYARFKISKYHALHHSLL